MALTWGALAAPLDRIDDASTAQELRVAPISAAALAPHYETRSALSRWTCADLDLTVPPNERSPRSRPGSTPAWAASTSWCPRTPTCGSPATAGLGSVEFDDREVDGPDARLTVDDLGDDGVASGRPLVLDVHAGIGSVEVHRD